MKKLIYLFAFLLISFVACEDNLDGRSDGEKAMTDGDYSSSLYSEGASTGGSSTSNNGNTGGEAGIVTAAEWNDLDNWTFWNELLVKTDSIDYPKYWSLYSNNRISVQVSNSSTAVYDATVTLSRNGSTVWQTKTDAKGKAELWLGVFQKESVFDLTQFTLKINEIDYNGELKFIEQGIVEVNTSTQTTSDRVELAFIVDATGSMSDELEFLKEDLKSVIERIEDDEPQLNIYTGTVFYRDEGDDYLTKHSAFNSDITSTLNFIKQQSANGGGDFPEAVHTALSIALSELQWSANARNRMAFLLLDAPPHYDADVITDLQKSIKTYAEKGIKIVPITASGIDKETEYLMRIMAQLSNGTYVFITNDSGVGNDHLEASVGQYEVEKLNDLLVRLIKDYSK